MDHDLGVMIDGFRALIWVQQHAEQMQDGTGWCRECGEFAMAILRGVPAQDALELRCGTVRAMQRQITAAGEVADRVCPF